MREIGSFIELQLPEYDEYYQGDDVARLNTGRAGIYHAVRLTHCSTLWLPYYQCPTVRHFLEDHGVKLKFYHINRDMLPVGLTPDDSEAVLIVNYFGIFSNERLKEYAKKYNNVIIDNSQAFFCNPVKNAYNVYSCRKFFGVPDGAYVIGKEATMYLDEYEQSHSSDTAGFLLERIEKGCSGEAYSHRMKNEERLDNEDVMLMSPLTKRLLRSIDYNVVKEKRKRNLWYAVSLLADTNELTIPIDGEAPMVYPYLLHDDSLYLRMLTNGHYQGPWWGEVYENVDRDSFEHELCVYLVPITIDQRYNESDIDYIASLI